METWLIIVLVAAVFLVVVGGILIYKGKTDTVKKIFLPLLAILGLGAAAGTALGSGSKDIRKEKKRIEEDLKKIEEQRDTLREEVKQKTEEHDKKVADLTEKIDASDQRAKDIKDDIETLKEGGPEKFVENLPPDKQQEIKKEIDRPGLPGEFLNPEGST